MIDNLSETDGTMAAVSRALIGDAYSSNYAWTVLESLTGIGNRMAGQAGEADGAAHLADRFAALGFREVTTTKFSVPGWWRGSSSLEVAVDQDRQFDASHELLALPGSPSANVSGEIVDVGAGTSEALEEADVNGKIALVSSKTPDDYGRWVHRTEKYNLAVDAGAIGFIFSNEIPGCLPLTGSIGWSGPGKIPAVGVSREVGRRLQLYCSEETPSGTLTVDARSEESTSRNVEAVIGPDTDEEVLLTAHVDAHDIAEGATDNGVGCALITEVGRLLDEHAELDTAVRLIAFGSEEIGLLGSHYWAKTHDRSPVKAVVNVDGNGRWEDVSVYTHAFERLADAFESIPEPLQADMDVTSDYLPHSDHWPFVQRGVPGAMIRSESSTGRGWGHTHGDTLDKLDPQPLRELAVALADAVIRLADTELTIPHHDISTVRDGLESAGEAAGLRASGSWPFEN